MQGCNATREGVMKPVLILAARHGHDFIGGESALAGPAQTFNPPLARGFPGLGRPEVSGLPLHFKFHFAAGTDAQRVPNTPRDRDLAFGGQTHNG